MDITAPPGKFRLKLILPSPSQPGLTLAAPAQTILPNQVRPNLPSQLQSTPSYPIQPYLPRSNLIPLQPYLPRSNLIPLQPISIPTVPLRSALVTPPQPALTILPQPVLTSLSQPTLTILPQPVPPLSALVSSPQLVPPLPALVSPPLPAMVSPPLPAMVSPPLPALVSPPQLGRPLPTPPQTIRYKCVRVGRRLRIRVITRGYNPTANCQFPRAIRAEGREYTSPVSALSFARGSAGKFFYRVKAKNIVVVDANNQLSEVPTTPATYRLNKVYSNDDCVICLSDPPALVFVPCGHHCVCVDCNKSLLNMNAYNCPMCRAHIRQAVTQDQIQT